MDGNEENVARKWLQRAVRLGMSSLILGNCCVWGMLAEHAGLDARSFWSVICLILFFGSCFIAFGWLLYCAHRYFRRWSYRVGGFAVLFIWTLLTLFFFSSDDGNALDGEGFGGRLLRVSGRASTVFLTHWKGIEAETLGGYELNASLLQLAIVFYLSALMFSFVGRRAFNAVRVRMTFDRRKNVFWGLSDRELLLARSIVKNSCDDQVQFNLPIEDSYNSSSLARLTDLADEMDAFWTFTDYSKLDAKCYRGAKHYFLSEDGHHNLALANQIVKAFIDDGKACTEKVLYVRAGDIDHEEIFSSWARKAYEESGHLIRPFIVREPEMIARKYVEQYPPLASSSLERKIDTRRAVLMGSGCRTLLLGLDHTGRAILNARLCQSRFVGDDGRSVVAFPITVVDMKQSRWDRYSLQAPEIVEKKDEYALEFVCLQVGLPEFERWFRERHADFDRIVFCLQGDGVNIREALRLRELLVELDDHRKQLLVRVASPKVNDFAKMKDESDLPLEYFGNLEDVYSVAFMNGDPVDRIARVLNWQWNVNLDLDHDGTKRQFIHGRDMRLIKEQEDDIARFWESASYYERLASRASAMAGLSFLRLLGLAWKHKDEIAANDVVVSVEEVDKRIGMAADAMARTEHLRWNTYMRSQGYRKWDLVAPRSVEDVAREKHLPSGYVPNRLAKQADAFRMHAAIVDFDALPAVDLQLAKTVSPRYFEKYTEADFRGRARTHVADGKFAASLQCKDYDCWSVFPEAVELAGFRFVALEEEKKTQCAGPARVRRKWRYLRSLRAKWRRWCAWMKRETYPTEEPYAQLGQGKRADVVRLAELSVRPYARGGALFEEPIYPLVGDGAFLSSRMIEQQKDVCVNGRLLTMFWFSDSISSHFRLFCGKGGEKTRFPYVFDRKSGSICPLSRVADRRERKKFAKEFKMNGRRVNFMHQPDFVAQVFHDESTEDNRIIVAFRGTASWSDFGEDVIQCLGKIPAQFRLAADLVRAICEEANLQQRLVLIGHSKGGGMVQYALMKNGIQRWTRVRRIDGMTFNAQRLSPHVLYKLRKFVETPDQLDDNRSSYANEHIENYRSRRDVVSGWLALGVNLLGRVYVVGERGRLGLKHHGLKGLIAALRSVS